MSEIEEKTNLLVRLTNTLMPDIISIQRDVDDFMKANNGKTKAEMAEKYADSICWKYASVGVATALPGAIPGLGTAAQIAVEAGGISADLSLMLRWMGSMTAGIAYIYGRDLTTNFNQEFIMVLGLWCGAIKTAQEATKKIGTKVAVAQFKKMPATIFKKINTLVGRTILTKYGTKRGAIAVGKLIPFGVGALVGGSFNLATMKAFKSKAVNFYKTADENTILITEE